MPAEPNLGTGSSLFAFVLRREREAAGLTQAELADRAGIGVRTVSNLERGINTSPYPSTVRVLADALGLGEQGRAELVASSGRRTGPGAARPTGGYLGAVPATGLVARADECATILEALAATAAGAGQVLLLAGEAGIGKTRLAQEATAFAVDRGFLVVSGRCFEEQTARPFAPAIEAFGALFDHAPAALQESVPQRRSALAPLLPDRLTVDPETSSAATVQVLHREATSFVRELAAQQPVALLLDDLHWADDATLDLFTHLARSTTADRVLLLGTYRSAEIGRTHPVRKLAHALQRERLIRAIDVGRFDRPATARLVSERLAGASVADDVGDLVHRHSDGNPFFSVEIVAALLERGDLTQTNGRWTCRSVEELAPPASVSEAIGERFARLSDPARAVLEAASVLGAAFDPDDVPGADEDELEAAFDEAIAAGLLTVDEDRYAFDHSLTQQALYAGLSPVRRRRLHRGVGERLESRNANLRRRRAAEISRHLELGGLLERALPFALLAGDVAASAFAGSEAVRLYGHVRELAEEVGDDASGTEALERIGQVELTAGRYDAALEPLVAAAERHRAAGDLAARLRVEGAIADLQHRRGEGEAAAVRLEEVLAQVDAGQDDWVAGGAALALGLARVRIYLGQHELCVEATDLARRLARQEGSVVAEAEACAVAGTALVFLDRPDESLRVHEEGVALAAGIDAPTVESSVLMGLQWATTMRGELDRSLELGERGVELTRRAGNTDLESQHVGGIGRTWYYLGDLERARSHLERSVELARASSPTLFSGIPPVYLGVVLAAQGDVAGARACFDEAEAAPDLQTFAFQGYLQACRADLDLRAGDARAALTRLEPWLEDEAPTKVHDVMLLTVAARTCVALGDTGRAEVLVARALRRAEVTRNQVDAVEARRVQAEVAALS